MTTGAPAVLKTFPCERRRLNSGYHRNPKVENLLRSRKVKGSGYCASRSRASYLALGALCGNLTSCWKTMNLKHTENNNSRQPEDKFNQRRMLLVSTRGKARLNEIGS